MLQLRVRILAFAEAKQDYIELGKERLRTMLPEYAEQFQFVEEQADILFVLSGGSEQTARQMAKKEKFYVILSNELDNSNAAALEIKAWMNREKIASKLLSNPEEMKTFLASYVELASAIESLKGKQLGLIGNVSDWLIASSVEKNVLMNKLGINLKQIDWKTLCSFEDAEVNTDFLTEFEYKNQEEKINASKIYSILKDCVDKENLDALTVECFPLVRQKSVTACLALSLFNDQQIPAGCEGDLVSIVGMMFAKEVSGSIPWMANVAKISKEATLFAHCTIGKNLLSDYKVTTHFETGLGTAIQGMYRYNDITVFRFNSELNKAFITTGNVLDRPQYATACRTQIEVKLPAKAVESLKENPLGNHHLILQGDQTEKLQLACALLGIEVI
jgi:L-fucose isomerase-like protein